MDRRNTFKLYGKPLKPRTQRVPTNELIAKANEFRAQRLANPSPAEDAFAEILESLGVPFARERIFFRNGSFILLDFFVRIKGRDVAIEADGSQHARQNWI